MVNHPNRKKKDGPLRVYLVYDGNRVLTRLTAYTAKSARHQAKRRYPGLELVVREAA